MSLDKTEVYVQVDDSNSCKSLETYRRVTATMWMLDYKYNANLHDESERLADAAALKCLEFILYQDDERNMETFSGPPIVKKTKQLLNSEKRLRTLKDVGFN